MKMYPTNNLVPVNSKQRQPDSVTIPVFNFVGLIELAALSDKWYPPTNMKITGGYVSATAIGIDDNEFYLLKSNIFEQNIEVGISNLAAGDNKSLFKINNVDYQSEYPYAQANVFTPFDYLTVYAAYPSQHSGVTIQLFGEKVN